MFQVPQLSDQAAKEEQERLKLKEERKREKAQDEEARRRVLEQIKLDRLRRQDANASQSVTAPKEASKSTPVAPVRMQQLPDMTRIQFRKPNGETVVDTFKSDGPFGDVWKYAKATLGVKDFVLATSMPPRREFSGEKLDETLIELNLAPSATLLVVPLTKPSLISSTTGPGAVAKITGFIFTLFWALMNPIMAIWNRIRGTQPGNSGGGQANVTQQGPEEVAAGPNISGEV